MEIAIAAAQAGKWVLLEKPIAMSAAEGRAIADAIAKAGIPILAVVGSADKTVPVSENIDIVEKRYQELGGTIEVIRKPHCGHHPHSLPDPAPIVNFVLSATGQ